MFGTDRPAQQGEFLDQQGQYCLKSSPGLAIGVLDLGANAECLDDQVDRSVLQVQTTTIRQQASDRATHRPASGPRSKSSGHGLPSRQGVVRNRPVASTSSSRCNRSMCPPSAA